MSPRYSIIPPPNPEEGDEDAPSLTEKNDIFQSNCWNQSLRTSLLATAALVLYTLAVSWVTKAALQHHHDRDVAAPASSFPHPDEKQYVIKQTGQVGEPWLHQLVYGEPSAEVDEAWFALLRPFNTRVPAERYEATMPNRPSVRVADGSGDYYVTLTVYHELHCLMRFRWFLYPEYYANKTWEEQAQDKFLMGHYRHCIASLLESVLCHGDTSMRTFHWDRTRPAPIPDSEAERKCVDWKWLYDWTGNHSFLLQDRILSHPTFGLLDENLKPVNGLPGNSE